MAGEKGKGKKVGRNKEKCATYRLLHRRERNKLKRILQSCGVDFASNWAKTYGVTQIFSEIKRGRKVKEKKNAVNESGSSR